MSFSLDSVHTIINIAESLTIIVATLFTAWRTFKTFAHKEKLNELKNMKKVINEYYRYFTLYCASLRETNEITDKDIEEKLRLAKYHNHLIELRDTCFYLPAKFRENIQGIVGNRIIGNKTEIMKRNKTDTKQQSEQKSKLFREMHKEYEEVNKLIDAQVDKYVPHVDVFKFKF